MKFTRAICLVLAMITMIASMPGQAQSAQCNLHDANWSPSPSSCNSDPPTPPPPGPEPSEPPQNRPPSDPPEPPSRRPPPEPPSVPPNCSRTVKAIIPPPAPSAAIEFQPPFPTVVGQDPNKRGVDPTVTVRLNHCTVIWHYRCVYVYHVWLNGGWEERTRVEEWDETELEADAMGNITINSALNPASVAYINGTLASIYPGTKVYQGALQVFPNPLSRVTMHAVGIPTTWQMKGEKLPYADPRTWDYSINLTTTGTPHCAPARWNRAFENILRVYLREERLVK